MAFGDFARLDGYDPNGGFKDTFRERFGAAPLSAEEAAALRQRQFTNRPSEASQETIDKLAGAASDVFIPKTPLDVGLTLATLPAGPLARPAARAGALALGALFEPSEAQAGVLSKIAKGIRAYHGSPHDFDKFDLSKIGTGEGAQAYGHGLYFAENEGVAREYRKALSNARNLKPEYASGEPLHWVERSVLNDYPGVASGKLSLDDAAKMAQEIGRTQHVKMFEDMKARGGLKPPGRMYEVSLNARPEQFLDWDKGGDKIYRDLSSKLAVDKAKPSLDKPPAWLPDIGDPMATAQLREAGIPGIRYLDQGSRDPLKMKELAADLEQYREAAKHWAATGNEQKLKIAQGQVDALEKRLASTSNYVVWMPEIIEIMRKYGLAGAGATGFGTLAAQNNYRQ
jgi:hypothetical protein